MTLTIYVMDLEFNPFGKWELSHVSVTAPSNVQWIISIYPFAVNIFFNFCRAMIECCMPFQNQNELLRFSVLSKLQVVVTLFKVLLVWIYLYIPRLVLGNWLSPEHRVSDKYIYAVELWKVSGNQDIYIVMFFLMHVSTFLQSLSIARMMRINLPPWIWINTIDYLLLWTLVIEHADPGHSLMSQRIIWTSKQFQILKITSLFWKKKESMARLYVSFRKLRIYKGWVYKNFETWVDGPNPAQPTSDMHHKGCPAVRKQVARPYHHQVGHVGPTWSFLRVVWNDQKSFLLQFSLFSVRFGQGNH